MCKILRKFPRSLFVNIDMFLPKSCLDQQSVSEVLKEAEVLKYGNFSANLGFKN